MIRGYLRNNGRLRPFVVARVSMPSQNATGDVHFLVDTGADGTLLAPRDALVLGVDPGGPTPGPPSTGVGGTTATGHARATITLDSHEFTIDLRVLNPRARTQRRALARIPSLLGRDILPHFALFYEERTRRVLLLTPEEADRLWQSVPERGFS